MPDNRTSKSSNEDIKKFTEIALKGIALTFIEELEVIERHLNQLREKMSKLESTLSIMEKNIFQKSNIITNFEEKNNLLPDDATSKKMKRKIDKELSAALELIDSK